MVKDLIKRIEESAKEFDPSGKGELSDKEMFNVLKIQNKVECKQDQVGGCRMLLSFASLLQSSQD